MTPITPKPSAPPVPTQNTTLPPKPAVTVTGGVRVEAAPEKVVEKISTANTVMIYAWNEFDEGGWLAPTLSEGAARIDALAKVLK